MTYQTIFDEKDGIVRVVFSGSPLKEDHYSALESVIQLCNEKKTSKVLIDFSGLDSSHLSTIDVFSFAEVVAKTKQILRIAHVFPKHLKARENIRFASSVSANRGKITKEFENVEDAVSWLSNN